MSDFRTIRLCLMVNGQYSDNPNDIYGDFQSWAAASVLPLQGSVQVQIDQYKSKELQYPTSVDDYDAVLLSGSPDDAWANDPWILRLISFVQDVELNHSKVKIYGICFGSQIVGRALGGKVNGGTAQEIGLFKVGLTFVGEEVFSKPDLNLWFIHSDEVDFDSIADRLAEGDFYLLGSSKRTKVQGLVKFYTDQEVQQNGFNSNTLLDSEDNFLSRIHVLSTQGHPEANAEIIADIIMGRYTTGGLTPEQRWNEKHDGIRVVGRAFFEMLGVIYPADPDAAVSKGVIDQARKISNEYEPGENTVSQDTA